MKKSFEERWRRVADVARTAPEPGGAGAWPEPERVWRRVQRGARPWTAAGPESSPDEAGWWHWYGVRGAAVAMLLVAGSVWFAWRGGGGGEVPLRPGVEDVVVEAFWLL